MISVFACRSSLGWAGRFTRVAYRVARTSSAIAPALCGSFGFSVSAIVRLCCKRRGCSEPKGQAHRADSAMRMPFVFRSGVFAARFWTRWCSRRVRTSNARRSPRTSQTAGCTFLKMRIRLDLFVERSKWRGSNKWRYRRVRIRKS